MVVFMMEIVLCIIAADFISGLFHWFEDTYLPVDNTLLDKWITLPNIEHHRIPANITKGSYIQTNRVSIILSIIACLVFWLSHINAWQLYAIAAISSQLNQVHAWAHTRKPPRLVLLLQRLGIMQSVDHHKGHHARPYNMRYCIGTNLLNPILDGVGLWRLLEKLIPMKVKRGTLERRGY